MEFVRASYVVVLGWFVWRWVSRERFYRRLLRATGAEEHLRLTDARFQGHAQDLVLLPFLLSPVVWPHHFILTLPVIILGLAPAGGLSRKWLLIGTALVLVPTTFEFYPFSYHRLLGLFMLLFAMAPGREIRLVPESALKEDVGR